MRAKKMAGNAPHAAPGRRKNSGNNQVDNGTTAIAVTRYFQAKRQENCIQHALLDSYVWERQTIEQLAGKHGRSHVWVKHRLDAASFPTRSLEPQPTPVAADMTFWGRGYGVIVFRSPTLKENLWWKESLFETPFVYHEGLRSLLSEGWTITGAVIDGKRGVAQVFEAQGIPVQYCHFHQIKTVTRYLTRKPKTEAAQELRALALTLPKSDEETFRTVLAAWYEKHQAFLNEKRPAPNKKRKWEYTHRRVRAAYRSLKQNLPRLYTYQKYPELKLPNTTNCLDGMLSQIKNRLAVHRGLWRDCRFKVISEILKGRKHSN